MRKISTKGDMTIWQICSLATLQRRNLERADKWYEEQQGRVPYSYEELKKFCNKENGWITYKKLWYIILRKVAPLLDL